MRKFYKIIVCAIIIASVLATGIAAFAAPSPKFDDDDLLPDISNVYVVGADNEILYELPVEYAELIQMHKTDRFTDEEIEVLNKAYKDTLKEKNPVLYFFWMDLSKISLEENERVLIVFTVPEITKESKVMFKVNGVHIGDENVIAGDETLYVYVVDSGAASIVEIKDEFRTAG